LTDELLLPPALARAGMGAVPSSILSRGERAGRRFIEFFTANIRNRNTRLAYARAIKQFFDWSEEQGLGLDGIEPMTVAAYIEPLGAEMAKPSVKTASGRDPATFRLLGYRWHPAVKSGRRGRN
jgi:integrase/recombinase XerD